MCLYVSLTICLRQEVSVWCAKIKMQGNRTHLPNSETSRYRAHTQSRENTGSLKAAVWFFSCCTLLDRVTS